MPRPAKPPRLRLERRKGRSAVWTVVDAGTTIRTGIPEKDRDAAASVLAAYIREKEKATVSGESDPAKVTIAEVLDFYERERVPELVRPIDIERHIRFLREFWGQCALSQVKGVNCREYVRWRTQFPDARVKNEARRPVKEAYARRDLETLSAAIGFYHAEFTLTSKPVVQMPPPAPRRDEYLEREEVAHLLRICRLRRVPHVARFILIAFYTGSRSNDVMDLRWCRSIDSGWVDLERGLLYRKGYGQRETNKRRPPVRIHRKLLPKLKRWHAMDSVNGITHVIHYKGHSIDKIRSAWEGVRHDAALGKHIVQHTFRHTCVTQLLNAGVPVWEVAGYVGMSVQMVEKHYGHHSADYQSAAANSVAPKRLANKTG